MLIAPNTSRDNELSSLMVPAGNPFVAGRCQNIENNPMQSSRQWPAFDQQLDTSGNSGIYFYYSELMQMSRHGLLSSCSWARTHKLEMSAFDGKAGTRPRPQECRLVDPERKWTGKNLIFSTL